MIILIRYRLILLTVGWGSSSSQSIEIWLNYLLFNV